MRDQFHSPADPAPPRRDRLSAEKQAKLAELLRGRAPTAQASVVPRRQGTGPVRASVGQRRLWFLDRLTPGSAAYSLPAARLLKGPLDVEALEKAIGEIIRRHESLRTTFRAVDGEPVLVVAPPSAYRLPVIDFGGRGVGAGDDLVRRLIEEEGSLPFDLERGPLFRARLLRLDPEEHILLVNFHHIIADGWSWGLFAQELAALYSAGLRGEVSAGLPELPCAYSDFAAWQEGWLEEKAQRAQVDYWKAKLGGELPVLALETTRTRPPVQSLRGSLVHRVLPQSLLEELRALARRNRATLFTVLLAAFKALLYRHTGQTDILVGTVVAGRRFPELEKLIGFFANTLVIRTDLSDDPPFFSLVERVRDETFEAASYQDVPFERLVTELGLSRDLSHTPLFQVMMAYQNAAENDLPLQGLETEIIPVPTGAAKFDLFVSVEDNPDRLALAIEYSTDVFDKDEVSSLFRRYETLLRSAVSHPEARLSTLDLLDDEDYQRLASYNPGRIAYPVSAASVAGLVEEQAARTPEATAVVSGGESLTYRELTARAARLANHLRSLGVGLETPVAISVERSFGLIIGLLGILKAGGAYIPLDSSYPQERLAYMLQDSQAGLIVTSRSLAAALPAEGRPLVLLDEGGAVIGEGEPGETWGAGGPGEAVEAAGLPEIHPENLAYIIYTSGSTGRPKGVMCTHGGIVDRLAWLRRELGLSSTDRVAQTAPVGFDISLLEIFGALSSGATLVLAKPGGQKDAAYLVRFIQDEAITFAQFVPSMLRLLIEERDFDKCLSLRLMISIGEALPYSTMSRFHSRLGIDLWNMYGPTETAVHVAAWRCPRDGRPGLVTIGRAIANVEARVLGPRFEIVPPGYAGELAFAGVGLARGYLGRPDLTALAFVPDPRPSRAGARLYRTGDLAKYLPTGEIDYLGRIDHQVKIRGFRVELGEIEAGLRRHPAVKDAVVVSGVDPSGDVRLVAYVVAGAGFRGGEPLISELKDALRRELPDYMVPSAFVFLEALPLLPNGKVDRKNLPAPDLSRRALGAPYVPPAPGVEETLASIWSGLLGLDKVGAEDNFFELGGHSLLAAQVSSRAREAFGVEVPLLLVFEQPTIRGLAAAIGRLRSSPEPASSGPMSRARSRLPSLEDIERLSEAEVDALLSQIATGKENR